MSKTSCINVLELCHNLTSDVDSSLGFEGNRKKEGKESRLREMWEGTVYLKIVLDQK